MGHSDILELQKYVFNDFMLNFEPLKPLKAKESHPATMGST